VRGIGIIVLSIVAGFSLASLVLQPWRDLATEAGVRGDMGDMAGAMGSFYLPPNLLNIIKLCNINMNHHEPSIIFGFSLKKDFPESRSQ
jgi:hypothetical protein